MTADPLGRMLVTVTAPHYCASLVIGRARAMTTVVVLEAAPILRWSLGKPWIGLAAYLKRKGFTVHLQPDPRPGT